MNINFAFLRHGYGCHNAIPNLVRNDIISSTDGNKFFEKKDSANIFTSDIKPLNDPVLTNIGVEASIYNGCIINKILKNMSKLSNDMNLKMDIFNVVGCSPLIRCMETSYYMTRKWKNPPKKIYVFPLLREINESSDNKYSKESKYIMDVTPSYSMLSIIEQKAYLKNLGILDFFDFSFIESFPQERNAPGDIIDFINWFNDYFVNLLISKTGNLNVFITTHAGVMKDFSKQGFYNNSGFVINTTLNKNFTINKYISLNDFLTSYNFFNKYNEYNNVQYYCPSDRCGQLCYVIKRTEFDASSPKQIGLQCNLD